MKIFDDDFEIDNKSEWLKITDFDNFFQIFEDKNGYNFYNLNNTMFFDFNDDDLDEYQVKHDSQWSLISYAIYGTTRLAWLLMKVNRIDATNVFQIIPAGSKVKMLPKTTVQAILTEVDDFGNV